MFSSAVLRPLSSDSIAAILPIILAGSALSVKPLVSSDDRLFKVIFSEIVGESVMSIDNVFNAAYIVAEETGEVPSSVISFSTEI